MNTKRPPSVGQQAVFRPPAVAEPGALAAAGTVEIVEERHHRASPTGKVYQVRNVDTGRQAVALPGELELVVSSTGRPMT